MNNNKTPRLDLVFLAIMLAGGSVLGSAQAADEKEEPGFYANAELRLGYDDNVRRNKEELDSFFFSIKPTLGWIGLYRRHSVNLNYKGGWAWYSDDRDDNFDDHKFEGTLNLDLTKKLDVNLAADFVHGHETRGRRHDSGNTRPDRFNQWGLFAEGIYGRRSQKAQLALAVETREIRYQNNEQEDRDRDTDNLRGTVFFNLGPKTQLLGQLDYIDTDYLSGSYFDNPYGLDSEEWRYQLGATWLATAKTSGKFTIGYFDRDMKDPLLEGGSGLTYRLGMVWQPKTYSTVNLHLSRNTDETLQDDTGYLVSTQVGVQWAHAIRPRLTGNLGFLYEFDEYKDGLFREDDLYDLDLGLVYQWKRYLDIGAEYRFEKRDSTFDSEDYTANVIFLKLIGTIE